jgi:hypothetical protein
MGGDEAAVLNLWRELTGDPDYVPEDLSRNWPVRLGSHTESLNLDWFALKYGAVSRRGEVVRHHNQWAGATLDAWSVAHDCPIECKHTGGREPLSTVHERYQPQMQWQMICTDATQCAASIILGASEPVVDFIPRDEAYQQQLLQRAEQFMRCVWRKVPPVPLPPIAAPVKAEVVYDFTTNNQWCSEAVTWITTRQARRDCEAAERSLKKLVPADAARCHGHGIEITRNRAGSLSLRELS